MPTLSRTATIEALAERVFAYVDDIRNLARHMSKRGSMPMLGSKLALEIVTPETTGIGAHQLGQWLAASYARWCLDSMVEGTKLDLERGSA